MDERDLTEVRKLLSAPDPTHEAYAAGRAKLFAAMDERPPMKDRQRRWSSVGTVLAAAAATVVIVSTVAGLPESMFKAPEQNPREAAAQPSARQVLFAAADAVAKAPASGDYWRIRTITGQRFLSPDRRYAITGSTSHETWLTPRQGAQGRRITQVLGAKPATPQDEMAWREAGAPGSWQYPANVKGLGDVAPSELVLGRQGPPRTVAAGRAAGSLTGEEVGWAELATIPSGVQELRTYLEERIKRVGAKYPEADVEKELDDWLHGNCMELLSGLPVSPQVRASAYRILASLPGMRAEGMVTDPLGRTGQALSYRVDNQDDRLVIDTASGLPLATEGKRTGSLADGRAVEIGSFTAYEEIGWTDQQPELPAGRD